MSLEEPGVGGGLGLGMVPILIDIGLNAVQELLDNFAKRCRTKEDSICEVEMDAYDHV